MNIQDLRSQFTIFFFMPEPSAELKQTFVTSGYETFMFIDQDLIVDRVREAAPHVIVFSIEALSSGLSDFVQSVLQINSEVHFICVADKAQTEALMDYRDYNFGPVLEPGDQFHFRALWAVDNVCEKLALQYMNESLADQNKGLLGEKEIIEKNVQDLGQQLQSVDGGPRVQDALDYFAKVDSKEDLLQKYFRFILMKKPESANGIFFKYLPSVSSFIATQAYPLDLERAKGVGAKLQLNEQNQLGQYVARREVPPSLQQVLKEAFRLESPVFIPLQLRNGLEGVYVFWNLSWNSSDEAEFRIFELYYQNFHVSKRIENLDILDPVTELNTRDFFEKRLHEEVSRSRRLSKPVSLLRLSVDHFAELEKKIGKAQRDLILRSIALLVRKTSRVNDYACRTADNELSFILPHSSHKGAALRAERLRKAIENHSFSVNGIHVNVSIGVSEYPTLSATADDLDMTSSEALRFISEKGGNKVCLYQPKEGFKPDFEVQPL